MAEPSSALSVRGGSRARGVRIAVGSLVLVACLLVLYGHEIFDGGRMLSGDMFDGRIADALQLHWLRVFAGSETWNRPDYFYPAKDTLGYNDGYFLLGVFFSAFHLLGFDVFAASELAGVPFRIAGFVGIYALAREAFGLRPAFSLLAASIGILANNIHLQQVHVQLLTIYLAPGTVFLVFRAAALARDGRPFASASCGALAAVLVSLWAITAFYSAIALLAALARRPSRLAAARRAAGLAFPGVPLLIAALGLVPFLLVYEPPRQHGAGRFWAETFLYTMPPEHLLDVAPGNLLASLLGTPDHVVIEYSVGLPLTLWVMAAVGIVAAVGGDVAGTPARAARLPLAVAFVVTLLLSLRFGNHAAWRAVAALVPGAEAIRVVCRIMLLLGLVAGCLAAIALEWLHTCRVPRFVTGCLAVLLVAEEVNVGGMYALPRREEDAFLARIPPPPRNCHSFVVTRGRAVAGEAPGSLLSALMIDTDAMLLAEIDALPTPLGDASFKPPGHTTVMDLGQAVLIAGGGQPVCGVDLVAGRWGEVTPEIATLGPGERIPFDDAHSANLVAGGWSDGGGGSRWTSGPAAELILRWTQPGPLLLHVRAQVGFGARRHPDRVDLFADGVPVARWTNDPAPADHRLVIPRAAIGADGIVHLRFAIHGAASPAALGMSLDDRDLGVAVTEIRAE